jgi:hypothetical protein
MRYWDEEADRVEHAVAERRLGTTLLGLVCFAVEAAGAQ